MMKLNIVNMSFKVCVIFICTALIVSCYSGVSVDTLSSEENNSYVKQCTRNWKANYYQINDVINAIALIEGEVNEFVLLKSSAPNGAYSFTALGKTNQENFLVFIDTPSLEIIKVSIPEKTINMFIDKFYSMVGDEDILIKGKTHKVSHIPCEFLVSKSNRKIRKIYIIGIVNESKYEQYIKNIRLLEDSYSQPIQNVLPNISPFPLKEDLDELANKIEKNLFFEIAGWMSKE